MTQEMTAPGAELYCPTCELHFPVGELCPDDGTRLVRLGAATDPFVGRELDGRYTIIEKLGQGGMGAVYRARQHSMGREVAVKVVNQSVVADAQSIKRFLREAKLVSRLTHPNIVAVLDFAQAPDGLFYLVMELVEGRTLQEAIVTEGRFPLPRINRIAAQICDALEGAHRMPIVHRDLKPANIMLLAAGRDLVKVLDFGLAKSLSIDNTSTTMTSAGALLGTPTFMPPEVANGEPFVDGRADLYSLGCILFMMGTGRPPFVSDSIPEMIAMHGSTPAPPMTGVPAPLARVVARLLRKDPDERYQTAAATREALEAAFDETRMRGLDPDTLDEELSPTLVPLGAETLDSGPPERPSEARRTNVYASAISHSIPVTPLSVPPPSASSQSSQSALPLPPPPLSVEREPARSATQLVDAPRRSRAVPIVAVAIVAVIAAIVIALLASRGGSDAPPVVPATPVTQPTAPVEPQPSPSAGPGSASSVTVEVPALPVVPPVTVTPSKKPPRVRPNPVRRPATGSGNGQRLRRRSRSEPVLMWRILGALALSSGCLFAPARPGDDMGGDDCTLPSEDADLPIVGVFPSGEGDMLVRAGIDRGVQRVNFYDPSPAFSPVCATRSVELTALGGIAVDKVLAIGRMTDRYLLVLVQRADTLAAVYQIDVTTDPPLLTQSAITSAAEIAPVRATPGPFVAYSERAGEVWFGGPLIHRATPGPTFGADSKLVTVTGHNQEGWYLAVGADALTNDRFVIVGQRADYPAISGSTGTTIDTQQTAPRDSTCDLDLPQCQDRTARAVTNAPPGAVPIAALSFTPEGQVTAVQTEGTALLLLQRDLVAGAAVLEDVALSLLAPTGVLPTTDAFTLTRTSINGRLAVEWHPNAFSTPIATPPASSFVLKTGAALERLVVGTFVPRKGPKILVLGNQPGLADAGETYLEVVDGELVEYPLPAR